MVSVTEITRLTFPVETQVSSIFFSVFQDSVLNKQLTYVLVDVILEELFPDLSKKSLK